MNVHVKDPRSSRHHTRPNFASLSVQSHMLAHAHHHRNYLDLEAARPSATTSTLELASLGLNMGFLET
jgi:hypothetical protein